MVLSIRLVAEVSTGSNVPGSSGVIYVDINQQVTATASTTFNPDVIPLATYIATTSSVTVTDARVFVQNNLELGQLGRLPLSLPEPHPPLAPPTLMPMLAIVMHATATAVTLVPNQGNSEGTTANLARADHTHNIATAAPVTSLSSVTTNATGSGSTTTFAQSDHTHAILTGTPVAITPDQANNAGISANLAKADHIHNIPTASAITIQPNLSNADGVQPTFARSDHVHNIVTASAVTLTATTTNTAGSSSTTTFAQSDHTHAIQTGIASQITPDQPSSAGTSASLARADHIHNIPTAAPASLQADLPNADGVAATFARSDHVHNLATAVPVDIGGTNQQGVHTTTFARSDHVHKGVHSFSTPNGLNTGEQFGDIVLQEGMGTLVSSNGFGVFTVDTTNGPNEFYIQPTTTGTTLSYSAGRVDLNGAVYNISSGTVTVTGSNGIIFVNPANQTVVSSTASTFPSNAVPIATYTYNSGTNVTTVTDSRVFLSTNLQFGLLADIQPVASTDAAGSTNRYADAGHVHQGLHSLTANSAGTERFGDVILQQGVGTTIVDNGSGVFTIDTVHGPNELFVTNSGSGLVANYTKGTVNINGIVTAIPAGSITLTANVTGGTIYVSPNGVVSQSTNTTFAPNVIPLATYTTGTSVITSITDTRALYYNSDNELVVTAGTGFNAVYASGRVNIAGTVYNISAGTVGVTGSSGTIYVNAAGIVTASTTTTFSQNVIPLATYTASGSAITSITDARSFISSSTLQTGLVSDIANVGSTASAGSTTRYADAGHVHQGLHSAKVTGGSQQYGDITFAQGNGTVVTTNGSGTFTIDTNGGPNQFFIPTTTNGLTLSYTGGLVNINGVNYSISSGTIGVTGATGNIYVDTTSHIVTYNNTSFPANSVPIATYSYSAGTTTVTDARVFVQNNQQFGLLADITNVELRRPPVPLIDMLMPVMFIKDCILLR